MGNENKLLYLATMSIDGFIAGVGGDMSWLRDYLGAAGPDADNVMAEVGALLVGTTRTPATIPTKGLRQKAPSAGSGMVRPLC